MFFPGKQTAQDHETLTHEHGRFSDTVCDAVIALQDSAFNLGRQRGHAEASELTAKLVEALRGVVRVADRATVEFDAARAVIAEAEAADTLTADLFAEGAKP